MMFYVYKADVWCEECTQAIKEKILQELVPDNPEDESSFDSNDYPKGPFESSYEEADTPMHCAGCDLFLENPLTPDGEAYVLDQEHVLPEWREFYDYLWE